MAQPKPKLAALTRGSDTLAQCLHWAVTFAHNEFRIALAAESYRKLWLRPA